MAAVGQAFRFHSGRFACRTFVLMILLSALGTLGSPVTAAEKKARNLAERYQQWLEDVRFIMLKQERKEFLELEEDHHRDAFIRRFWQSRDPDPQTPDNPFKGSYLARLEEARELFEWQRDERRKVFVLNGRPTFVEDIDCGLLLWPLERWWYQYSAHAGGELTLFFYQPTGAGPWRLWDPGEGYPKLARFVVDPNANRADFRQLMFASCTEFWEDIERILTDLRVYEEAANLAILAANDLPQYDPEWLSTFRAFSTELAPGARRIAADLEVDYPGLFKQRVIVRGSLEVPVDQVEVVDLGGGSSFNFALTGEVLRDGELFESFKYLFDVPETEATRERVPLVFERRLRPGGYRLVVKLEDIHSGAACRIEEEIEVPKLDGPVGSAALAVAADASSPSVATTIELVAEGKDLQRGYARFGARVDGDDVAKVRFLLEDRPILTKTRPPFSVELDLGSLPETMAVRAVALDSEGRELATDEILLNPGQYSFGISLIEPRWGSRQSGAVAARAEVETPEGATLNRVEFFRDDQRVATLFQEPFVAEIPLVHEGLVVIRAVAFLKDGNSTEDVVILNGGDHMEQVEVRLVEVFASVLDASGRPLSELERDDFAVLENGKTQQILRFERLENLPIYAGLLIDTSASMAERMEPVREAAVRFFEQTMRAQDRAAVVTFADQPRLAAGFTQDIDGLTGALAGITAGQGTALYDAVLFSLYQFKGLKGQRALLVLSDGEDRRSRATFEEAREFALASGVTLYTIGVEKGMTRRGKAELGRLAEETGGRAFLIDSVAELTEVYDSIQRDLRSKYFLAYQPLSSEGRAFRTIEVRVAEPGAEVRALRGYVPR